MQTTIFPDIYKSVIRTPNGHFPAPKLAMIDMTFWQVIAAGNGVPMF
jgi:hypothetical protein